MVAPTRRFMMRLLWLLPLAAGGRAAAATLLFSTLDSLEGWTVRTLGPAQVRIVSDQAAESAHVELRSDGGTVLLSRELPRDDVAGCRLELACLLKPDDVRPGPEVLHTAKVHLALETPRGPKHFAARFRGSGPWREEGLVADVPGDVRRAVLNIGLEACAGRLSVGRVSVRNDRRSVWPLPLARVANAQFSQLGLGLLPPGDVQWHGIPFHLIAGAGNANDCVRLRGRGHDDWPAAMAALPVGRYATAVYLLHAALDGPADVKRGAAETPCALWTARLAGGFEEGLSVFEGRQIGPLGSTEDLENWKIAWPPSAGRRSPAGSGRKVTWGVTRWPLYFGAPAVALECRAYQGAPVLLLAVTAIEEPPAAKSGISGDDESPAEQ